MANGWGDSDEDEDEFDETNQDQSYQPNHKLTASIVGLPNGMQIGQTNLYHNSMGESDSKTDSEIDHLNQLKNYVPPTNI